MLDQQGFYLLAELRLVLTGTIQEPVSLEGVLDFQGFKEH